MNFWINVFLILGIYLMVWSFFLKKVPAFRIPPLKSAWQGIITVVILVVYVLKGGALDTMFNFGNYILIFCLILVCLMDIVLKEKPEKSTESV